MTKVDKNLFLYNFSIGLIAKDEGHYIREWLEYHLYAGCDHFFIYDNDSTDNQKEVIQDYIDKGIVEYIHWPGKEAQIPMMADVMIRARYSSRYLAIIDVDEFIVPYGFDDSIPDIVDKFSNILFSNLISGVGFHWALYGTNGNEKANYDIPVLERCPKRSKTFIRYPKFITNPRKAAEFPNFTHYYNSFSGYRPLFFNREFQEIDTTNFNIVLNHYSAKSKEEFEIKMNRGSALRSGRLMKEEWHRFDSANKNDVTDTRAIEYRDIRKNIGYKPRELDYEKMIKIIVNIIQNVEKKYKRLVENDFNNTIEELLVSRYVVDVLKERDIVEEETYKDLNKMVMNCITLMFDNKNNRILDFRSTLLHYEMERGRVILN